MPREVGIDISQHRPKVAAETPADEVDAVITLCAGEACPVFPGRAPRLRRRLAVLFAVSQADSPRPGRRSTGPPGP